MWAPEIAAGCREVRKRSQIGWVVSLSGVVFTTLPAFEQERRFVIPIALNSAEMTGTTVL